MWFLFVCFKWQKQTNIFWLTDVEIRGEIATFQLTIVEVTQSMTRCDSEHGLRSQADVVPSLAWCDLRHPWWQWRDLLRRVVMKTALARVVSGNQDNLGIVYLGITVFAEVRSGFWEPQGRVQCPGAMSPAQVTWRGKERAWWPEARDSAAEATRIARQEPWTWAERWSCSVVTQLGRS